MKAMKTVLFVGIVPAILVTCFFTDVIHQEQKITRKPAVEIAYIKAFKH